MLQCVANSDINAPPMKQDLNTASTSIPLWTYTDPVQFLKAHYELQKRNSPGFSYAQWANEMGLKSRSFLRLVLIGKRNLTEETAELFAKTLRLNALEKNYFMNLVKLHRATTLEEKEVSSRELAKLRQKFALKSHSITEIQQKDLYDFLSSYKIPRLQVLLNMKDLKKTEGNLSQIMKIKESELTSLLQILERLELAYKDESQQWQANESKLMTPDLLGNVALQSFHKKSLTEAIDSITLPKETRRFQSLVLAMTQEQFVELHQDIRQHLELLLKKFENQQSGEQKVYQINFNIIPVTESIFREEQTHAPIESPETEVENENK